MDTKVGVLSAGGDCPGINSAIRWLVHSALDKDLVARRGLMFKIFGIVDGWKGLMEVEPQKKSSLKRWTIPLTTDSVRTWDRQGGTRLGTSRINPFDPKKDQSDLVVEHYKKLGLDALVAMSSVMMLVAESNPRV